MLNTFWFGSGSGSLWSTKFPASVTPKYLAATLNSSGVSNCDSSARVQQ